MCKTFKNLQEVKVCLDQIIRINIFNAYAIEEDI